jgi:hypothetical protein
MHIPFVIAILACLALMLLPVLDRYASPEINAMTPRSRLVRLARWAKD